MREEEFIPDRSRWLRAVAMLALGGALLNCSGCLQTLLTAMVAPEALAAGGASGGVQAVGSALSPETVASGSDLASTANDLQRIIDAHPDAANRPELEALQDKLAQESGKTNQSSRVGSLAEDPERRAERDRRVPEVKNPYEWSWGGNPSDNFVVDTPAHTRRTHNTSLRPLDEPHVMDEWEPQIYNMSLNHVRLK